MTGLISGEDDHVVYAFVAKMSDERVSRFVISHCSDRQYARAERREIVSRVGAASWNSLRFAMFEDEDGGFAGDARDFAVLEFVGDKIPKQDNRFRCELLNAFSKGEEVNGGRS
jgi:hypothetical protein